MINPTDLLPGNEKSNTRKVRRVFLLRNLQDRCGTRRVIVVNLSHTEVSPKGCAIRTSFLDNT